MNVQESTATGSQRLNLTQLQAWEKLGYGMFIHFGMSTYAECELPTGNDPLNLYNPTSLDVDQWISVARDAGMKYAVLTTKHVAGHCLWPSRYTAYTVENSPVKIDVVEAFVAGFPHGNSHTDIIYGFVKQDNGMYSCAGATMPQLKLMRRHCGPDVQIKAAGGIRSLKDILLVRSLGVSRVGATATAAILDEAKNLIETGKGISADLTGCCIY